jgi:aminodeoxyfutalosine deaminase
VAAYPKIELHVHLEGSVRPDLLFAIARRNGAALPVASIDELRQLYRFRDFAHFIEIYLAVVRVLSRPQDFRDITVAYAAEAAAHGAVYVEAIFGPTDAVAAGASWDDVFAGFCEGALEAYERHGVRMLLTPDISRQSGLEAAELTLRHALRYRDRGVVGLGLGGLEAEYPPEPFRPVFERARAEGLASVPHAGEAAGSRSVWGALEALGAARIRHGVRSVEDEGLVRELAGRGTVLDVCPLSNLRTGVVTSLAAHPLPRLVAAGVPCSLATDDPAMFDTDLGREHAAAVSMGLDPRGFYQAGLAGALCDPEEKRRLAAIGDAWWGPDGSA